MCPCVDCRMRRRDRVVTFFVSRLDKMFRYARYKGWISPKQWKL